MRAEDHRLRPGATNELPVPRGAGDESWRFALRSSLERRGASGTVGRPSVAAGASAHPARGDALVPRARADPPPAVLQRGDRRVVGGLHPRRAPADARAEHPGSTALPGSSWGLEVTPRQLVLPAELQAQREGAERALRRGVPRGDAPADQDLRGDRHAHARRADEAGRWSDEGCNARDLA